MSAGLMLVGLAGAASLTVLTAMLGAGGGLLVFAYVGGGALAIAIAAVLVVEDTVPQ